jgi:RND superfamily putative drug exporter
VLERWTRAVLRFRLAVLASWVVVLVLGGAASTRLAPLLSNSFAVPGSDSERARTILAHEFGDRPDGTFVAVFRVAHPDPATRAHLRRRLAAAARVVPGAHASELRRGGGLLFGEIDTTLDLAHAKRYTPLVRAALRGAPPAIVTGQPAIQHDLDPIFASDLRRGEAIAVPAALLVLLAVLGVSFAVLVPFVFAACTIALTYALLYGIAHGMALVTYVTNLVALIGVGLAVDYSLLVVHRFREELERGGSTDDAVVRTMVTAGRAVLFSAVAVAIGLGLLTLMPLPFIRGMGVAGFLIPLASLAAAATLQPVMLSVLGQRGVRAVGFAGLLTPPETGGFWSGLAHRIMRRPLLFLAAGVLVLAAAAAPARSLRITPGSFSSIPAGPESARGYDLLRRRVGAGFATTTQVVVRPANRPSTRRSIDRLADALFHDPEVMLVASGRMPPYTADGGRFARVIVAARHDWGDAATRRLVRRVRAQLVPRARFPAGTEVMVGGAPAQGVDFVARTYRAFRWLVAAVLGLTFVMLLGAFRSLLLPLKAVVLNVLTVAAAYGLLVLIFDRPIDAWIPVLLFATVFGLSMDYEVFLVSRIGEAWEASGDNTYAVAEGLQRSGRVITAAALIMIAAFSGFIAGEILALREFGAGLAIAIALDATIVRAVLVPSFMAVLGRWNWWLPGIGAGGGAR